MSMQSPPRSGGSIAAVYLEPSRFILSSAAALFLSSCAPSWNLGQPFEIQYQINDPSMPTRLDLSGFQTGPLKGRTLYCLIDLSNDTLRMDCEPTAHPASFNPEQTQVFSRKSRGA